MSLVREIQQRLLADYAKRLEVRPSWHVLDVGIGGDKTKPSDNYRFFPSDHFVTLDKDAHWRPSHVGDICNPPFADDSFDLVLICQTLEHVWEPQRALWECHRILKPGGWIIADVPFLYEFHGKPDQADDDFWRISHTALTRMCKHVGFVGEAKLYDGVLTSILCQKPLK